MTKKAIGSKEFKELTEERQLDILQQDGVYVGKRKLGEQTVVLYQLSGFYVEVFYEHYRKKIERIITSDNTDILQPYISQVNVRDLNKDQGTGNVQK